MRLTRFLPALLLALGACSSSADPSASADSDASEDQAIVDETVDDVSATAAYARLVWGIDFEVENTILVRHTLDG